MISMKGFSYELLCERNSKMFQRRLSAQGHEKAREFPRDPVLKDMRRYMGNPSYSYVHIEVKLASALSLLCLKPGMISTLGVLSLAPPQLRMFSTLRALSFAPPQLREKIEKPNGFLFKYSGKRFYEFRTDLRE